MAVYLSQFPCLTSLPQPLANSPSLTISPPLPFPTSTPTMNIINLCNIFIFTNVKGGKYLILFIHLIMNAVVLLFVFTSPV